MMLARARFGLGRVSCGPCLGAILQKDWQEQNKFLVEFLHCAQGWRRTLHPATGLSCLLCSLQVMQRHALLEKRLQEPCHFQMLSPACSLRTQ